jgi:acetyltransferase-like isoleucine patch superfamily enzyme
MKDPQTTLLLTQFYAAWQNVKDYLSQNERSDKLRTEILSGLAGLVLTDDERAKFYNLPQGCRIRESAKIIAANNLSCGEYVWIGENTVVDASGGLTIGAHTTVAVGANIWTHTSVMSCLMMDNSSGNPWITRTPTEIGKGCYIGGPSSIYPGVSLGDHCVVMPMSTVTQSFPAYSMIGGSPAKLVKTIDDKWISDFQAKHHLPNGQRKE